MPVGSARSSLGGTAVLMACACGAASSSAKLVALAGLGATTTLIHPAFAAIGAGLVLFGLWHTRRRSAGIAAGAFVVLAAAALLTPPTVMTVRGMDDMHPGPGLPWSSLQMLGAALYVLAGIILAYAFWTAYPSRKPSASATAIGGMVLSTGCTACCMVTGAVAGMAVTFGASATYFETLPVVFWTGLTVAAIGLYRLAGWRPVGWVLLGGLITPAGKIAYRLYPQALDLSGLWKVGGVDLVFIPKYLTYFAGAAVILYGFAVAFRAARVTSSATAWVPAEDAVPEVVGAD